MPLSLRFALRELRSGVAGFRIFLACLALGVAAIAAAGIPVFAFKGENLVEYWEYAHKIFEWGDGGYPNLILDDGGDATLLTPFAPRRRPPSTGRLNARGQRPGSKVRCLFC